MLFIPDFSSRRFLFLTLSAIFLVTLAASRPATAADAVVSMEANTRGETLYNANCASCHAMPEETRSPPLENLQRMGARAVGYALTTGKMRVQAEQLNPDQIDAIVSWLSAAADVDNSWIARHTCPAERAAVDVGTPTIWTQGITRGNHRYLSAGQAGLTTRDLGNLELAWAMGFPSTGNMRSQPAVVGNTVFQPIVDSGQLFALDIGGEPCVKWVYEHDVPLRTTVGYHTLKDGTPVLLFGDAAQHAILMHAETAEVLWSTSVRMVSVANITAMPVLYGDRVFVPVSTGELLMAAAPDYECCTSHGTVVAIDVYTGEREWVFHTMEDAQPTTVSRVGTQQWGPSGAPIWTAAAIDETRGHLLVGTGENNSAPATDSSDAVLAIRLADGSLAWQFQATANDIYINGCAGEADGPNCPPPDSINRDVDFGAAIMLAQTANGEDIVLAGQKSGEVWALDPGDGSLIWTTKIGPGGAAGGIHWGMAFDGETLFAANNMSSDPTGDGIDPGLFALDVNTGAIKWAYHHQPDCSGDRRERIPSCDGNWGMSAATLVVDGAVIQGSNDGFVKIFDTATGEPIFSFDTARSFDTVNGVEARGGSVGNYSLWAANGMLFVQSGYGLGGVPGNVLLAFRPR